MIQNSIGKEDKSKVFLSHLYPTHLVLHPPTPFSQQQPVLSHSCLSFPRSLMQIHSYIIFFLLFEQMVAPYINYSVPCFFRLNILDERYFNISS